MNVAFRTSSTVAVRTMRSTLRGMRVALLDARITEARAAVVTRHSGVPYCVPVLRDDAFDEAERRADLATAIDWLEGDKRVVLVPSARAVAALFHAARAASEVPRLRAGLARATTICRGPKTAQALARRGVPGALVAAPPHTTRETLEALDDVSLAGCEVLVVRHGRRAHDLVLLDALARGRVPTREIVLNEGRLPDDLRPLRRLVDEIVERRVGAVAFTSRAQLRELLRVAKDEGRHAELLDALRNHTVVAAIGPACARALRAMGVPPRVVPARPRLGPLVQSLARYVEMPRVAV